MQRIKMSKEKELTVKQCAELFLRKCKIKNLTDRTIDYYERKFEFLYQYLDKDSLIEEVTIDTVDNYIIWLRENTQGNDITINSHLRAIRALLYYAMECNYLVPFKIHMPKTEKKIKETYTDAELERLLKKPDIKKVSFATYRTWVFENYLLGTGNRISTACDLQIKDISFDDGVITLCKTKNRRQQIIPLSATLSAILSEYLEYRGGCDDDYVFCNDFGNRASIRTYQDLVARYNIGRNVNKTSCHLFRHTFAKNWILAGGDIFRLQKILGHSDLTVTKEYVNMFGADLQLDFEKFNPLDRLNQKPTQIHMR